jgi:DNA-directed RNA polymerase specialized sigma24 family protein
MNTDNDFKKIYDNYHPRIFQYLSKMVGPTEAEDITQDVFNKINCSNSDLI